MKLNYQQMLKTFGLTYSYANYEESAFVKEEFNTLDSYSFQKEDTLEKALTKLKEEISESSQKELQRLESLKETFNNLSFIEKLGWRIEKKKLNFDSTAEQRKKDFITKTENKLKNIEINKIDKTKEYTINSPMILKTGDKLYVVVTDKNTLDMGVYEATANNVSYFERKEGFIDLNGMLLINNENKEHEFGFSSNEKGFESKHSYHHIFTEKDKAVDFHNESISEKMKNMEEKIINLNNKPKPKIR